MSPAFPTKAEDVWGHPTNKKEKYVTRYPNRFQGRKVKGGSNAKSKMLNL